jgi:hypothetical protein
MIGATSCSEINEVSPQADKTAKTFLNPNNPYSTYGAKLITAFADARDSAQIVFDAESYSFYSIADEMTLEIEIVDQDRTAIAMLYNKLQGEGSALLPPFSDFVENVRNYEPIPEEEIVSTALENQEESGLNEAGAELLKNLVHRAQTTSNYDEFIEVVDSLENEVQLNDVDVSAQGKATLFKAFSTAKHAAKLYEQGLDGDGGGGVPPLNGPIWGFINRALGTTQREWDCAGPILAGAATSVVNPGAGVVIIIGGILNADRIGCFD